MTHLLTIVVFALLVSFVFGILGRDTRREQLRYGASVFAKFVGIAFVLAWALYFLPI